MSENLINHTQNLPIANDRQPSHDLVNDELLNCIVEVTERKNFGLKKYKVPLQAFNGRLVFTDALDEILDAIVYLNNAREEYPELSSEINHIYYTLIGISLQLKNLKQQYDKPRITNRTPDN